MTCDDIARTGNLLGALALAIADELRDATEQAAGQGGMAPAALVQVGSAPGQSIDHLRRSLGLSHSATVRVVMQMEAKGWVLKSRSSAADARVATLSLTASGRAAMSKVLAARRRRLEKLVNALPAAARQQLTSLLEQLLPRLVHAPDMSEIICRLCDLRACPQDQCPTVPA